ncbi:hydantoinase/oxoprolinase N-terminal domain-containing protein [Brevibacillus marinus]|uniref:hydantoinase/oxoprolinase N-terminal domain-containing protein n=1 Tax=Brevibacillus marinus TaxID=2496837 RepID=UPI000F83DBBB|nr:hydantoinase/oxoprolinase N-terminal domain-containing protein [Brevibacillus marinus]
MYRLGINVGDTYTDGVLMTREHKIVAAVREGSAAGELRGITAAVQGLLKQSGCVPEQIATVVIGTGSGFHAFDQTAPVSVCGIRLTPEPSWLVPLADADSTVRSCIRLTTLHLTGGHEFDGAPTKGEPSRAEAKKLFEALSQHPFDAFAVTSTFSAVNDRHERMVADWLQETFGSRVSITLSHEFGGIGFMRRENAALLNAALVKGMVKRLAGVDELLREQEIRAKLYLTQNDGSLMSYRYALSYPLLTLFSGIANSFRGAAFLSGIKDCLVVDVSPTAIHVGKLEGGVPKESRRMSTFAGVPLNLPVPDLVTLPISAAEQASEAAIEAVYQAVQRFQPRYEPLPVVFVGIGSERVAALYKDPWAEVIQPAHYDQASAIGCCIAPVSGSVDRMYSLKQMSRTEAIQLATDQAIKAAIRAGADPKSVVVQSVEASPLAYVPSQTLRIKAKAVGRLP